RQVYEEISLTSNYLHVSSKKENNIFRSHLEIDGKPAYEIGVIEGKLDACILTVIRKGFTNSTLRFSDLERWSKSHKGNELEKIKLVEDLFGIGMVIIKVKDGNVVIHKPSNSLSRY